MEVRRFACMQCGMCCDRSPELLLSEAAGLVDVFVFRLMFRLYTLPRAVGDFLAAGSATERSAELFFQRKRLLGDFAARKYQRRTRINGKNVEAVRYLMISALALDTSPGTCSALTDRRCGIYDRRPFACRTLPAHYSRVEASAESDLRAFLEKPGYACDTGETAPAFLEKGRIVHPGTLEARSEAAASRSRESPWQAEIARRIHGAGSSAAPVPSFDEIEANAAFGATTTSMRVAWQIALESGLIGGDEFRRLIESQRIVIGRELGKNRALTDSRQTLVEMRAEYESVLGH